MSNLYSVEDVLGKKVERGEIKYLIKWVGYSVEDSTWEPAKNLTNIIHLIKKYEQKLVDEAQAKLKLIDNEKIKKINSAGLIISSDEEEDTKEEERKVKEK